MTQTGMVMGTPAVPLAGAGARQDRRPPLRPVRDRLPALRTPRAAAAVHRRDPAVGGLPARPGHPGAAVRGRRRGAAGAGRPGHALARQGARRPVPDRRGDARADPVRRCRCCTTRAATPAPGTPARSTMHEGGSTPAMGIAGTAALPHPGDSGTTQIPSADAAARPCGGGTTAASRGTATGAAAAASCGSSRCSRWSRSRRVSRWRCRTAAATAAGTDTTKSPTTSQTEKETTPSESTSDEPTDEPTDQDTGTGGDPDFTPSYTPRRAPRRPRQPASRPTTRTTTPDRRADGRPDDRSRPVRRTTPTDRPAASHHRADSGTSGRRRRTPAPCRDTSLHARVDPESGSTRACVSGSGTLMAELRRVLARSTRPVQPANASHTASYSRVHHTASAEAAGNCGSARLSPALVVPAQYPEVVEPLPPHAVHGRREFGGGGAARRAGRRARRPVPSPGRACRAGRTKKIAAARTASSARGWTPSRSQSTIAAGVVAPVEHVQAGGSRRAPSPPSRPAAGRRSACCSRRARRSRRRCSGEFVEGVGAGGGGVRGRAGRRSRSRRCSRGVGGGRPRTGRRRVAGARGVRHHLLQGTRARRPGAPRAAGTGRG